MRAITALTLATLVSAASVSGAAVAGEATYLTPPLFREQARETQQARSLGDLTTTPQPVAPAKSGTASQSAQAGNEVETTGSF